MPLASSTVGCSSPTRAGVVPRLHGGRSRREPNHPWSGNVARLVPFARALRQVPGPLAVARLRFRYRGWNGPSSHSVDDARALEQVSDGIPRRPRSVSSATRWAGAPPCRRTTPTSRGPRTRARGSSEGDPRPRDGQKTVLIHGDRDVIPRCRLASPVDEMLAARAGRHAHPRGPGDHAMLVAPGSGTALVGDLVAARFARELGRRPESPDPEPIGAVVARRPRRSSPSSTSDGGLGRPRLCRPGPRYVGRA